MSGIIRSQFGYHIIKLTAVKAFEDADKARIKQLVYEERRVHLFEKLMTQLKNQATIVMHPELLSEK